MKKHVTVHIYGRVQGVFFRAHAHEEAGKLHISGFIRNEPDGSVHVEAEGEERNLEAFLNWCRRGPPLAKITRFQSHEGELVGYTDFEIKHD